MHESLPLDPPAAWSLTVGAIGRGALVFAGVAALISILAWLLAGRQKRAERIGAWAFTGSCLGLLTAFGALAALMVQRRYEYSYVFKHSDNTAEIQYRIAALWAGQEGSFLLWAVAAAIFGLLAVRRTAMYRRWFTVAYAVFLGCLSSILAFESPFKLELFDGKYAPPDGAGLNPTLYNYWITIHPPTIFLGFGSLTVLFAWSVAALAERNLSDWVAMIRPWVITTATLTGVGLCMGGFWAYETLGWGGFWAWDPVENTSFVPWLWSVALIHGLMVQATRGKWAFGNAFLAGSSLLTFLYGTFLTRSGFLGDTSVHSFASMDRQALWILVRMVIGIGLGFVGLWGWRLWQARHQESESVAITDYPTHRTAFFTVGIWLLIGLAISAAIGMSVPFIQSIAGKSPKKVEEFFYNRVSFWFYVPLMIGMAMAPFASWKGQPFRALLGRLATSFSISAILMAGLMALLKFGTADWHKPMAEDRVPMPGGFSVPVGPWILFLSWLAIFAICANLSRSTLLLRRSWTSVGGLLTHVGVIVAVLGLILSRGLERKEEAVVQAGRPGFALGYVISLESTKGKNFLQRDNQIDFLFKDLRGNNFSASPVIYYTPPTEEGQEPRPITRPAIISRGWYDVYVASYPLAFEAGDPITLAPGKDTLFDGYTIRYRKFELKGEAGMLGTKFLAELEFTKNGKTEVRTAGIEIGANGPQKITAETNEFHLDAQRIDPKTRELSLQLYYKEALYPLDIFYKPFTKLVWGGTGIMLLGGILAAFNRRVSPRPGRGPTIGVAETADGVERKESDAVVSAP